MVFHVVVVEISATIVFSYPFHGVAMQLEQLHHLPQQHKANEKAINVVTTAPALLPLASILVLLVLLLMVVLLWTATVRHRKVPAQEEVSQEEPIGPSNDEPLRNSINSARPQQQQPIITASDTFGTDDDRQGDHDESTTAWRCACQGGFLPPGMLKTFGGAEAVLRLSMGQCYHKKQS